MTDVEIHNAIRENHPLPASLTTTGSLYLEGYTHPLPASLTTTGILNLRGYTYPLPASLTTTGALYLEGYTHPLPASLTTTGFLYLRGYTYPLPASLTTTGFLGLGGYTHPLPASLTTTGILYLRGYTYPLPASLTATGFLGLEGYTHPLTASLMANIRKDMFNVLDHAPGEVNGLLAAIREGRIDGSTYSGKCACLVGTLEASRRVSIEHNSHRPAEQWFIGIHPGDTPATNPKARQAESWVLEWMKQRVDA